MSMFYPQIYKNNNLILIRKKINFIFILNNKFSSNVRKILQNEFNSNLIGTFDKKFEFDLNL